MQPEDRVLVIGAGGIGLCMAFALSTAVPVTPFEITDLVPSRLNLVVAAVEPLGRGVPAPVGEYDIVFDVSGSASGLRLACEHVRGGGRLCSMSHLAGYTSGEFLLELLTRRDVTFTVSYLNGKPENLARAVQLLLERWDPRWDRLIEVVPVAGLQEVFEQRRSSPFCKTILDVG